MSTKSHCDGTGVEIPDDTPTTGLFGRQYSVEARPIAEEYLEKLNELHTLLAQRFQSELDHLRTVYREKLSSLPDEP